MNRKDTHIRLQQVYCPHCGKVTEQGIWVQTMLGKTREYADCLTCDNTDSLRSKNEKGTSAK